MVDRGRIGAAIRKFVRDAIKVAHLLPGPADVNACNYHVVFELALQFTERLTHSINIL